MPYRDLLSDPPKTKNYIPVVSATTEHYRTIQCYTKGPDARAQTLKMFENPTTNMRNKEKAIDHDRNSSTFDRPS